MKTTAIIMQVTGMLSVIAFGVNIFKPYTMNDPLWLAMLFFGITLFGIGAKIEYSEKNCLSRAEFERTREQHRTARNLVYCGLVGLLFCIVLIIKQL